MELEHYYTNHVEWSRSTFGPIEDRTIDGVIEHLRKELDEVKEAGDKLARLKQGPPGSVSGAIALSNAYGEYSEEVADIIILALELANVLDVGATQLAATLVYKQDKNKEREWPSLDEQEPGKPIEHIKKDE